MSNIVNSKPMAYYSEGCDANSNGEVRLMMSLPIGLTILDVGCRDDSIFKGYPGEVHYFDPVSSVVDVLAAKPGFNTKAFYVKFGLSDKEETISYYPRYAAFFNRTKSCGTDDSKNSILLSVMRADKYIEDNKVGTIGLLKIDTEGHELNVLKGFGEKLHSVERVQFEYGGTYLDSGITLLNVVDYLKSFGFGSFSYLRSYGLMPLTDYSDHYTYSNIYCEREGVAPLRV